VSSRRRILSRIILSPRFKDHGKKDCTVGRLDDPPEEESNEGIKRVSAGDAERGGDARVTPGGHD